MSFCIRCLFHFLWRMINMLQNYFPFFLGLFHDFFKVIDPTRCKTIINPIIKNISAGFISVVCSGIKNVYDKLDRNKKYTKMFFSYFGPIRLANRAEVFYQRLRHWHCHKWQKLESRQQKLSYWLSWQFESSFQSECTSAVVMTSLTQSSVHLFKKR